MSILDRMESIATVSYSDIEKNPGVYLLRIKEALAKEEDSLFLMPVGHMDDDSANRLADSLENACELDGVTELDRLIVEDEPVICIKFQQNMRYVS